MSGFSDLTDGYSSTRTDSYHRNASIQNRHPTFKIVIILLGGSKACLRIKHQTKRNYQILIGFLYHDSRSSVFKFINHIIDTVVILQLLRTDVRIDRKYFN